MKNYKTAINHERLGNELQSEADFIRHDVDLMPVVPTTKPVMRRILEKLFPWLLIFCCRVPSRGQLPRDKNLRFISGATINCFVNTVFTGIGLGLLIGPMWWLQYQTHPAKQLGIITGFVILFTALLQSATVAKTFEVMAATAA